MFAGNAVRKSHELSREEWESAKEASEWLACVLDIGLYLLQCGAEIYRVEDSMQRIARAYGAQETEALATVYSIVVTIYSPEYGYLTQSRRVKKISNNLHAVSELNDLSRRICIHPLPPAEVKAELHWILGKPGYPWYVVAAGYAIAAAAFSLFFSGTGEEAILSGVIGAVMAFVERLLDKSGINRLFVVFGSSFAAGILIAGLGQLLPDISMRKVVLGDIMPLIPGLLFTNSIRDMFMYNIASGSIRLCEAIFISFAIAFGFNIAFALLGI